MLGADAFARGVIRSRTDFQVYAQGVEGDSSRLHAIAHMCFLRRFVQGQIKGMEGVDFAFYKNRALYHTPLDSIPGMGSVEGKKALWSMMDATKGASVALLNEDDADTSDGGVYFDCESHLSLIEQHVGIEVIFSVRKRPLSLPSKISVHRERRDAGNRTHFRARSSSLGHTLITRTHKYVEFSVLSHLNCH